MIQYQYHRLYYVFTLLAAVFVFTSCERKVPAREYEEIVISSPSQNLMGSKNDPHAFMRNMPPMDVGQPNASPDMQLPAGDNSQQMQKILDDSVARPPLSWETPKGWTEEKGGGMRLATFRTDSIECSIVSLGGQAGGLQSNVIRWLRQINVTAPSADQLNSFLSRQKAIKTKGDFSITVIDLTELSEGEQSPSMIASVARLPNMTIFVKMTGNRKNVAANREKFESLCQSLAIN